MQGSIGLEQSSQRRKGPSLEPRPAGSNFGRACGFYLETPIAASAGVMRTRAGFEIPTADAEVADAGRSVSPCAATRRFCEGAREGADKAAARDRRGGEREERGQKHQIALCLYWAIWGAVVLVSGCIVIGALSGCATSGGKTQSPTTQAGILAAAPVERIPVKVDAGIAELTRALVEATPLGKEAIGSAIKWLISIKGDSIELRAANAERERVYAAALDQVRTQAAAEIKTANELREKAEGKTIQAEAALGEEQGHFWSFIQRRWWAIALAIWAALGTAAVLLIWLKPTGWGLTIGKKLLNLIPLSNPFSWWACRVAP